MGGAADQGDVTLVASVGYYLVLNVTAQEGAQTLSSRIFFGDSVRSQQRSSASLDYPYS